MPMNRCLHCGRNKEEDGIDLIELTEVGEPDRDLKYSCDDCLHDFGVLHNVVNELHARITGLEKREAQLEDGWRNAEDRYEKKIAYLENKLESMRNCRNCGKMGAEFCRYGTYAMQKCIDNGFEKWQPIHGQEGDS